MPMRFPYLKAARVKLQERKNECLRANYSSAKVYTKSAVAFLRANPVTRPIMLQLATIGQNKFAEFSTLFDHDHPYLRLPTDAEERAAYHLRLLELFNSDSDSDMEHLPDFHYLFGVDGSRIQDGIDAFLAHILIPLCTYVDERIDDGDLLLYMLSRYQRECGWFIAGDLEKTVIAADSRKHEEVLDQHLRSWLFREGIDYPFSTPRSPSGRADIAIWHGEEPLAIEVKVYDGNNRDSAHVTQGLSQAQRYAQDYGKAFGYLVVFNRSSHQLVFENNVNKDHGPPCVMVGDISVFVVVVDVGSDRATASVEKPREAKTVKSPA